MNENEKFLEMWGPHHEKGLWNYWWPYALKALLAGIVLIAVLILLFRPTEMERVLNVFFTNGVIFIVVIYARFTEWHKREERYDSLKKSTPPIDSSEV